VSAEGPPFTLHGLDHVVLRVRDEERALSFYCGTLGCREERRIDALGLVQLRSGSALIDLVPVQGALGAAGGAAPGEEGRNVDHFALRIDPFEPETLQAWLRGRGAEVLGEPASRYGAEGEGPSLYVRDPDGNTVELKGPPDGAAS
jgi:catechol 2,3-dioxygenase-like lactoylglutathione lyase family enzyme